MEKSIVYYSKNIQPLSVLGPLQQQLQGLYISPKRASCRYFREYYGALRTQLQREWLGRFDPALKKIKDCDIFICGLIHDRLLKRTSAKKVMMFHGTFRHLAPHFIEELQLFDYLLLNGPRQTRQITKYPGQLDVAYHEIGYIPFDTFPEATPHNKKILANKLQLDPDKPTVVYVPARRTVGSWNQYALSIAEEAPESCNVVLRPHPNQVYGAQRQERHIYEQLQKIIATRGNIKLDLGKALFPELMCVADLLISDATSPTEEALYYDIPQIITENYPRSGWEKEYQRSNMDKPTIQELLSIYDLGISFTQRGFKNWGAAIEDALANPKREQAQRQQYFYNAFGEYKSGAIARAKTFLASIAT